MVSIGWAIAAVVFFSCIFFSLGFATAAMMVVAKESDEQADRMYRRDFGTART